MNHLSTERLYQLLPAVYRLRDAGQGEPLRALLSVIERELQAVEADIDGLYDNWFIETCDQWVVPYIGDLLGVHALHSITRRASTQRAYVANTLAYRRRKGTAAVLEQLARDVTGWPARVVEFFELLATTQNLNHLRLAHLSLSGLRDTNQLELLGGPFERAARSADVRRIARSRGKYNIPNVGLFLWRLQSYVVTRSDARAVAAPPDGRHTFSPLGDDIPLFNRPYTEAQITHLAEEINVPGALRRRPVYDELEGRRQALVDGGAPRSDYFDARRPVFQVFVDGAEVAPEEILIYDLSDPPIPLAAGWRRPPSSGAPTRADATPVAVDPVLGRLAFPVGVTPGRVQVSYSYGFSGDVGGGPYNRQDSVRQWYEPDTRGVDWQIGVTQEQATLSGAPDPTQLVGTLGEALTRWNDHGQENPHTLGLIAVMDSGTYHEQLPLIKIPAGSQLAIVAGDWPLTHMPGSPDRQRRIVGQVVPDGRRPHVVGDMRVRGQRGELVLDGLLLEGRLTVLAGDLAALHLAHCTLVPATSGLRVTAQNAQLRISIERSICGAIGLPPTAPNLRLVESIVDSTNGAAIVAAGANADVQASTVLGSTTVRSLEAANSVFSGLIKVEQRQVGCLRFSYVPDGSRTPRRYRCQPDLALKDTRVPRKHDGIRKQLSPSFTSTRYGDPAYAQLSRTCAEEIRTGAEDGAEMGVFNGLQQPQREANLHASLAEHLRVGLEVGFFYVT